MNTTFSNKQGGVALVTAMFFIAIVATLATFLAVSQQTWLRQAQNLSDLSQADGITRGAIQLAGVLLLENAKKSSAITDLAEILNKPVPLPVDGGFVTIEIEDAQSRFNLNNLVTGVGTNRAANENEVVSFEQLLIDLDLDTSLKSSLVDWLDPDTNVESNGGAEDLDYANQAPPYRAANRALESVDELRRVRGFTREVVEKLRDHVTALPNDGNAIPINVNTAKPEVIAAVTRVPVSALPSAADGKNARLFTSKQNFEASLPNAQGTRGIQANRGSYDVKTDMFTVKVTTQVGRITRRTDALVQRSSGQLIVHWQQPTRWQIVPDEPDA